MSKPLLAGLAVMQMLLFSCKTAPLVDGAFVSPNGDMRAIVLKSESDDVKIETKRGAQIGLFQEYRTVIESNWTPDSLFFVVSTADPQGHFPWHTHTFFFSAVHRQWFHLDDLIGPVTEERFILRPPHTIETAVRDYDQGPNGGSKSVVVDLAEASVALMREKP